MLQTTTPLLISMIPVEVIKVIHCSKQIVTIPSFLDFNSKKLHRGSLLLQYWSNLQEHEKKTNTHLFFP